MKISEISIEKKRNYVPTDLKITEWKSIHSFYEELNTRTISSVIDLKKLIADLSELDAVLSEDLGWRYIKMTCDTTDEKLQSDYTFFISEIYPNVAPYANALNKKICDSLFAKDLDKEVYFIYLRGLNNAIELFREVNISINTEIKNEEQKYGSIAAAQTILHDEKELTLQQAMVYLKSSNREVRKEVYLKVQERRNEDENKLNDLYSRLISLRHKIALNANFSNFRDYMHKDLARFDYSIQDCYSFHEAVKNHIVPLCKELESERKAKLNLDIYRPWDTEFDVDGKEPLHPFKSSDELTEKTIKCFNKIDPFFGDCIDLMKKMNHLDLDSRKGKAPGGYNYPLYETGIPFIFMNSAGVLRDVVTMVHEGGHALHSILTRNLPLTENKSTPSEVAELASMSMELMSMENWEVFFDTEQDFVRAKKEQLEKVIKTLPWIAAIDKFQHWIYLNPTHAIDERLDYWELLMKEFGTGAVNNIGYEKYLRRNWQGQLHLFEVPFYYIEYGFAQLGALAIWKNYKQEGKETLGQYKDFLKLGYTKTIAEIYKAAGIKFDFSGEYIKEISDFLRSEYQSLNK